MRNKVVLALLLCVGAVGCRHKLPAYAIPAGALVPVTLEEEPSAAVDEITIATLPPPDLGPFPETPPTLPIPRRRPAAPHEETPQPVTPPPDQAPAELAIGSLSTGVDASPRIQQQTQGMIASIEQRVEALSGRAAEAQRKDMNRVRNLLKQAQQALNTGDIDGAKNLATKAYVLMDGLEKR